MPHSISVRPKRLSRSDPVPRDALFKASASMDVLEVLYHKDALVPVRLRVQTLQCTY